MIQAAWWVGQGPALRAVNQQRPTWELVGFLDDRPELAGTQRAR